jgi:flagellar basal-body rod protein FlgG
MDPLTITAGAGLRSRAEALDLLANNLANASTSGFKVDRESYTLYTGEESWQTVSPFVEQHRTDFSQGQLKQTGDPQDVALDGKGFFLVDGPEGPLLTRNGSFRVSKDGKLTTPEGYEFATVEPRRILASAGEMIEIDPDGVVRQNGAELGRLKLVDSPPEAQPQKREGAYFALDTRDVAGLAASRARVQQGKTEAANFSPAEASIRLVNILRQFETMQKALQIGGEMGRRAVEEVARVQP